MMYYIFSIIINVILACFFLLVGIVSILMLWMPIIRTEVITFILEDSVAIFLFGIAFCVIGLFILAQIVLNSRRTFYHIKCGKNRTVIDEAVISGYLTSYWKELFPKVDIPHRLKIKRNKVHLFADLPYVPLSQQTVVLERIKQDLSELFSRSFGYQGPFYLSATFKKE